MKFVRAEHLKVGMRLARPIYNKKGVLLYERNSKLTHQGVNSIRNFDLIGIFILEPAEPVPPMTADDIAFERFQTMMVFAIREELLSMIDIMKEAKMQSVVSFILKSYGRLDRKINFVQNLRTSEDQIYKHSLNVAILSALISHSMGMDQEEQLELVIAAIIHDIGKITAMQELGFKKAYSEEEMEKIKLYEMRGHSLIEQIYGTRPNIKTLCAQAARAVSDYKAGNKCKIPLLAGAKVLMLADVYDTMTAMKLNQAPESEISVLKMFYDKPDIFDPAVVEGMVKSIHIIVPGVSVELNNGEKAIVITENTENILEPVLLMFHDNTIIDLSNKKKNRHLYINDVMKTLDNRHIFDVDTLRANGLMVKEPEFVEVSGGNDEEDVDEYVPGRDY